MDDYILHVTASGDMSKIANQVDGIGGTITNTLPTIRVIAFSADPQLISAISALPGVSSVAKDREVRLIDPVE